MDMGGGGGGAGGKSSRADGRLERVLDTSTHAIITRDADLSRATLLCVDERHDLVGLVLPAAQEAEVAGPHEAEPVVEREPHPQRHRVDDRIARDPERPHLEVVLDAVCAVLCEPARDHRPAVALQALLDAVEGWEVDEGVVHKVVEGDLLAEVAQPRGVPELLRERLRCKGGHARPEPLEEADIEAVLEDAEVGAAKHDEDPVPLPVDRVALLDVALHEEVAQRSFHGGDDDVELEWLRSCESQRALADCHRFCRSDASSGASACDGAVIACAGFGDWPEEQTKH
mmetsp:Transcript_43014/g.140166  ORF Transcript_43014/g.140166 Transcript_43014/m.140166 type:complete len:286 (+) Transcript_43014:54-911(+)